MAIVNKIRQNRKRFLTTMVIIILSATMVNYGLYNVLDFYFDTVDTAYTGAQLNMIITGVIISIVTLILFILLPKKNVDEMFAELEGKHSKDKTEKEILQDMIDEEIEEKTD